MDNLLEYYKIRGLDIIRIRAVFGDDIEALPSEIVDILTNARYLKVQQFYVKGQVDPHVFNFKQIMSIILQNQHILPGYKFNNPLGINRTRGGVR